MSGMIKLYLTCLMKSSDIFLKNMKPENDEIELLQFILNAVFLNEKMQILFQTPNVQGRKYIKLAFVINIALNNFNILENYEVGKKNEVMIKG